LIADKYEHDERVRKEKKCGAVFKSCTATNCCALGCLCKWQNKFFGQCEGPKGSKFCDAAAVTAQYQDATAKLPGLNKEKHHLLEIKEAKSKVAVNTEKNRKDVTARSAREMAAAQKEFKVSTEEPATEAKKKIEAAEKLAEKKIAAAKAEEEKDTAEAKHQADEADAEKKKKLGEAKSRRDAEKDAFARAGHCAKALTKAKQQLASAKSSVGSWKRAAKGHGCGSKDDVMGF